jgi:hypothetical protein
MEEDSLKPCGRRKLKAIPKGGHDLFLLYISSLLKSGNLSCKDWITVAFKLTLCHHFEESSEN